MVFNTEIVQQLFGTSEEGVDLSRLQKAGKPEVSIANRGGRVIELLQESTTNPSALNLSGCKHQREGIATEEPSLTWSTCSCVRYPRFLSDISRGGEETGAAIGGKTRLDYR